MAQRIAAVLAVVAVSLLQTTTLVTAFSEADLSESQLKNLHLGLCPGFTLEACLPWRIAADESLPACESNADCAQHKLNNDDAAGEAYCCPSKCAGMRCIPFKQHPFGKDECPTVDTGALLANCFAIGYECRADCKCCLDAVSCKRQCVD